MSGIISKFENKIVQRHINLVVDLVLVFAAVLSTAKLVIMGLTVDEEYAVAMSYRNAIGDGMFTYMWEPHQTSGFICTALIRAFIIVTGNTDHLVIFLRISGFFIEALVSLFVYSTLHKKYSKHLSFTASLLAFLILPKWILTPEFSNILIWSLICLMMSLFRLCFDTGKTVLWSALAGVFTCTAILAYPSCILAVPFILVAVHISGKENSRKSALITLVTCVVIGGAYIISFLIRMSPSDLFFGVGQMLSDGSHSSVAYKASWILTELKSWIIPSVIILSISAVVYLVCQKVNKLEKKTLSFGLIMLIASMIIQVIYWLMPSNSYFNRPLLYFYIAFVLGLIAFKNDKKRMWVFFVPNIAVWVCVMLVTNTGFRVTGAFLFPGIILALIMICEEKNLHAARLSVFLLVFILFFARGYLVIENSGFRESVQYVKQKALSGPAHGIYCVYNDGYSYNTAADLLREYAAPGDTILVAGSHSLWYMLGDVKIGTYSTISTPTFDERLLSYYEYYPDRMPDLVIGEEDSEEMDIVKDLLGLGEPLESRNGLVIYRLKMV